MTASDIIREVFERLARLEGRVDVLEQFPQALADATKALGEVPSVLESSEESGS